MKICESRAAPAVAHPAGMVVVPSARDDARAGADWPPSAQLFRCEDGALGLRGEFDWSYPVDSLLAWVQPYRDEACVVVDMAGVRYLDHRVVLALDAHARAGPVPMVFRSAPPSVARLVELLPVGHLSIGAEEAAAQ